MLLNKLLLIHSRQGFIRQHSAAHCFKVSRNVFKTVRAHARGNPVLNILDSLYQLLHAQSEFFGSWPLALGVNATREEQQRNEKQFVLDMNTHFCSSVLVAVIRAKLLLTSPRDPFEDWVFWSNGRIKSETAGHREHSSSTILRRLESIADNNQVQVI
jgi:hypothetical protein